MKPSEEGHLSDFEPCRRENTNDRPPQSGTVII